MNAHYFFFAFRWMVCGCENRQTCAFFECTVRSSAGRFWNGVTAVLSSAKIGTASWRYYTDCVACRTTEYYLGVGEAPGRWHGRGLEQLGLEPGAVVTEQQLEAMFARGLHPGTGDRLGRAWRADGVTGFDMTFSSPKSVSALWALGSDEMAAAAMAAHRAAVKAGLSYLDTHAGLSRRGTDGFEQVATEGLVAALFDHRTSRAGDPQLHTHALVLNKVRCADGTWRTLDATELFHHKKSAGMIYQAALRNEMSQRLGVQFHEVNEHGQAEIRGIPAELLKMWSKRTAAIDLEALPKIAEYEKLLGRTLSRSERAAVMKTAVLKTRPGKTHPEAAALHATWAEEAARAGWTPERLRDAVPTQPVGAGRDRARKGPGRDAGVLPTDPADSAGGGPSLAHTLAGVLPTNPGEPERTGAEDEAVVLAGLQAAGQRRAVFSRADVAGQIAARLPTSGLTATEVVARVEQLTDLAVALTEAVPVGAPVRGVTPRASDPRYATVQVLSAEARILSLAEQGRRAGYGRVPHQLREAATTIGRLDPDQQAALGRLTGGGDFLSVLTAPAGAGKTATLGATTLAWEQAGYRVIGLAPSARAAAELAAATGGRTDTLAKWLHNQTRLAQLPASERAWTALDDRTVLILDEASMASTLDLDTLTRLAAQSASKVVLVGDPGQIGVINGPGGMLAALSHAGHGIELGQIHRFTVDWERQATLQLRKGDPTILGTYDVTGRLHPCPDGDTALDGVFTHWAAARAEGQDALMLARTRADVDALNARARAAALTDGLISGPVTSEGERDWQAGDLLRTRRNNRRLTLDHPSGHARGQDPDRVGQDSRQHGQDSDRHGQGSDRPGQESGPVTGQASGQGPGHVRNGDRYRVLGPGPDGGLIVEDLAGRGTVVLPADYLAEHCEYGWASTIDGAQGVTADLGLVLVRPGIDREHLYVAMTRGRHGNHAYITPDVSSDPDGDDHHGPGPGVGGRPATGDQQHGTAGDTAAVQQLREQAMQVLRTAVVTSGAQDAAHTALATAREAAANAARRQAERQAAQAEARRRATRQLPPEHQKTLQQLTDRRAEHAQLQIRQADLQATLDQAREQLGALPRWARHSRRDALQGTITQVQQQVGQAQREQGSVAAEIERLTRRADQQARERDTTATDTARASARRAWADVWDGTGLTSPRPTRDPWPQTPCGPETPSRTGPGLSSPSYYPQPPQPGRGRGR